MKSYSGGATSGGIGVCGILQIVFIVLKCLKLIDWSWWAVFIPTFVEIGLFIVAVLIAILLESFDK